MKLLFALLLTIGSFADEKTGKFALTPAERIRLDHGSDSGRTENQPLAIPAFSEFENLLEIDSTCAESKEIRAGLKNYSALLTSSSTSSADVMKANSALKRRIQDIAASNSDCRFPALSTYLLGSTYLLTSGLHDRLNTGDRRVPVSMAWAYFTLAALNQKVVIFADGRPSDVKGRDKKFHRILGSYHCKSVTVRIDPVQSPLDLGATMIHELSHLFADRFDVDETGFRDSPQLLPEKLLVEETQAALLAGYVQRSFFSERLSPQLRDEPLGDLSFFERGGALDRLAQKSREEVKSILYGPSLYAPNLIGRKALCMEYDSDDGNVRPEIREFTRRLLDKIYRPYFGESFDSAKLRRLEGQRRDSDFNCALPYLDAHYLPYIEWWSSAQDHVLKYVASSKYHFFTGWLWAYVSGTWKHLDVILDAEPALGTKGPSQTCLTFSKKVRQQKLRGYLGEKTPSQQPGTDGTRPGTDGMRPGVDGMRPGTDGMRPDTDAGKLCIQIGDQL